MKPEPIATMLFDEVVPNVRSKVGHAWLRACRNEDERDVGEIRVDRLEGRDLLLALLNLRYAETLACEGVSDPAVAEIRDFMQQSARGFEWGQSASVRNGVLEKLVTIDVTRQASGCHQSTSTYIVKVLLAIIYEAYHPPVREALLREPRWWFPLEQTLEGDLLGRIKERLNGARARMLKQFKDVSRAWLDEREEQLLRGEREREKGHEILSHFDDPDQRKRRAHALAGQSRAMKVRLDRRHVHIPFTLQYEPDLVDGSYRSIELRGDPPAPTFPYVIDAVDRGAPYELSSEQRRDDEVRQVASALHSDGAAFFNGAKLAAIRRLRRDARGLVFEFHGVKYYDYFAANVISDTEYQGPERPECVWSQPRGAFPGVSALVITSDGYAVLAVRGKRAAVDRNTINASVSGAVELDDVEPPDGHAVAAPFEEALLREGESEISKIFSAAARRNSTLTFLGMMRNLHRNFLAELLWLVELHDLTSDEWIKRWRTSAVLLDEAYELADETQSPQRGGRGKPFKLEWLPSLLFVRQDLLIKHAAKVIDPGHLLFDRLIGDYESRSKGQIGLKTTLDGHPSFGAGMRRRAFEVLQKRQPAPPLIAALGAYLHMLARSRC